MSSELKYPPMPRIMPNEADKDGFMDGWKTGRRQAMLDILAYCRGNNDKTMTVIAEMVAEVKGERR